MKKAITDYLYDIPDKWDTPLITGSLFTVGDYVDMHFLNHNCAEYGSVLALQRLRNSKIQSNPL